MEGSPDPRPTPQPHHRSGCLDEDDGAPFAQQLVTITKQEHIELRHRANYLEAQLSRAQSKIKDLEQQVLLKEAKIKDLQNRLFGKKSEKGTTAKSEKGNSGSQSNRTRGQQSGNRGHGRTQRAHLPIVYDEIDVAEDEKKCPTCGLPHLRNPGLDEHSDVIEVKVRAIPAAITAQPIHATRAAPATRRRQSSLLRPRPDWFLAAPMGSASGWKSF